MINLFQRREGTNKPPEVTTHLTQQQDPRAALLTTPPYRSASLELHRSLPAVSSSTLHSLPQQQEAKAGLLPTPSYGPTEPELRRSLPDVSSSTLIPSASPKLGESFPNIFPKQPVTAYADLRNPRTINKQVRSQPASPQMRYPNPALIYYANKLRQIRVQCNNDTTPNRFSYFSKENTLFVYDYLSTLIEHNHIALLQLQPNRATLFHENGIIFSVLCASNGEFKCLVDIPTEDQKASFVLSLHIDSDDSQEESLYSCWIHSAYNESACQSTRQYFLASEPFNPEYVVKLEKGPEYQGKIRTYSKLPFGFFQSLIIEKKLPLSSPLYQQLDNIIEQMIERLCYLHDRGYVHRLIGPYSFSFFKKGTQFHLKLDRIEEVAKVKIPTPITTYAAGFESPEMMTFIIDEHAYNQTERYSLAEYYFFKNPKQYQDSSLSPKFSNDIFALGLLLYYLHYGEMPYSTPENYTHLIEKIQKIPLLEKCLSPNASWRNSIHEVLNIHRESVKKRRCLIHTLSSHKDELSHLTAHKADVEMDFKKNMANENERYQREMGRIKKDKSDTEDLIKTLTELLDQSFKPFIPHSPSAKIRGLSRSDGALNIMYPRRAEMAHGYLPKDRLSSDTTKASSPSQKNQPF